MLKPEYQYNWNMYANSIHITGYNLSNISAFVQLKDYLTGQKLLFFNEADWLEAAIHDTLLDED